MSVVRSYLYAIGSCSRFVRNGYPKCCSQTKGNCPPNSIPGCEGNRNQPGNSICTYSPDYSCYKSGWPQCCSSTTFLVGLEIDLSSLLSLLPYLMSSYIYHCNSWCCCMYSAPRFSRFVISCPDRVIAPMRQNTTATVRVGRLVAAVMVASIAPRPSLDAMSMVLMLSIPSRRTKKISLSILPLPMRKMILPKTCSTALMGPLCWPTLIGAIATSPVTVMAEWIMTATGKVEINCAWSCCIMMIFFHLFHVIYSQPNFEWTITF